MLIGFEAKRLFRNFTGLGNYSRFVVNALSVHYSNDHFYLFTPSAKSHPEVDPIVRRSNISVVSPPAYNPSFTRSIWRTWGIGREKISKSLDVFHGLSHELPFGLPNHVNKVVTVHDLIFLHYPHFYNFIDVKIYKAKIKHACENADKIIAISQQTADDLVKFLHVDKSRIVIIYQGCHPNFKREVSPEERQSVRGRYDLPEKYILNVGTIESRKNVLLIVKALLQIPESDRLPLVIVGRKTAYADTVLDFIRKNKQENWVRMIHHASFPDFPAIYQGAEMFIYPSMIEGFGIPLIEAIESGVPVITSTGSALVEAAGPASVFVNPQDDKQLAKAIQDIAGNESMRQTMITQSAVHVQKFQPQVIASDLMNLYKSLV